jgi:peptidoglycan hydrolase CwlO-like protein
MSDLYFKIERKSRREKDLTVVSLVVGKASEDIKARVSPDNSTLDGAKDLLNDMVGSIDAYNLEIQIKDQEETVKKNQRKYDGLIDDQKDYEKKIKNLQDKLEENRKDQQKQQDEVKKQQSLLETLKGKRKS